MRQIIPFSKLVWGSSLAQTEKNIVLISRVDLFPIITEPKIIFLRILHYKMIKIIPEKETSC